MAYILGFFAADGYITHNNRGAQFWSIQITDKSLLVQIKKIIAAEHKISTRVRVGDEKTLYRLQIGSKEMCGDLEKLGFSPMKTKNMSVPEIPGKYLPHFVRGYFDGDGNIWCGMTHKERKTTHMVIQTAFTSCSKKFLKDLHGRLSKTLGLRGSLVVLIKGRKNPCFRLQYSTKDSLQLYKFMYNRATIRLLRKQKQFEGSIKKICGRKK
jgi:intein-encoded DNA endonuclease-like protein